MLVECKVGHMRIDGSVSHAQRAKLVEQFQTDEETRVAVLSTKTSGVGLTLTRATWAIIMELEFSPEWMLQAEARLHRWGQTEEVRVSYWVVKHSMDENVWQILNRKINHARKVIDNHHTQRKRIKTIDYKPE